MRHYALIYLNGERLEVPPSQAKMMLADFLRYHRGLTGTKIVCAEGDCGSCTVLRAFPGFSKSNPIYQPVNSCILTVAQMDGSSLVTVEALSDGEKLSPAQDAMRVCHGSQCGFCTPGFVMAITGLMEKRLGEQNLQPISDRNAKNALTGNLCRCTGYQPIIDAAKTIDLKEYQSLSEKFYSLEQNRELRKAMKEEMLLEDGGYRFYAPSSLKKAAVDLAKGSRRILGAATDLGVTHNKWKQRLDSVVSLHLIPELYEITASQTKGKKEARCAITIGARVNLTEVRTFVKDLVPEFAKFLDLFASPQIKNVATLVGNVANASPIADTPPFLLAMDAEVQVAGSRKDRSIAISEFFTGYRKTALKAGELIKAIKFFVPEATDYLALKKVSERKDLDISCVNAAVRIVWKDSNKKKIKEARVAFGGVAATTLRLKKTENFLSDSEINEPMINQAIECLQKEIAPLTDLRGSDVFRRVLAENLLRRCLLEAKS